MRRYLFLIGSKETKDYWATNGVDQRAMRPDAIWRYTMSGGKSWLRQGRTIDERAFELATCVPTCISHREPVHDGARVETLGVCEEDEC